MVRVGFGLLGYLFVLSSAVQGTILSEISHCGLGIVAGETLLTIRRLHETVLTSREGSIRREIALLDELGAEELRWERRLIENTPRAPIRELLELIRMRRAFYLSARNAGVLWGIIKRIPPDRYLGEVSANQIHLSRAYNQYAKDHPTLQEIEDQSSLFAWTFGRSIEADLKATPSTESNRRARFFLTQFYYLLEERALAGEDRDDIGLFRYVSRHLYVEDRSQFSLMHSEMRFADPLPVDQRDWLRALEHAVQGAGFDFTHFFGDHDGFNAHYYGAPFGWKHLVHEPMQIRSDVPTLAYLTRAYRRPDMEKIIAFAPHSDLEAAFPSWILGKNRAGRNRLKTVSRVAPHLLLRARTPGGQTLLEFAVERENYEAAAILRDAARSWGEG